MGSVWEGSKLYEQSNQAARDAAELAARNPDLCEEATKRLGEEAKDVTVESCNVNERRSTGGVWTGEEIKMNIATDGCDFPSSLLITYTPPTAYLDGMRDKSIIYDVLTTFGHDTWDATWIVDFRGNDVNRTILEDKTFDSNARLLSGVVKNSCPDKFPMLATCFEMRDVLGQRGYTVGHGADCGNGSGPASFVVKKDGVSHTVRVETPSGCDGCPTQVTADGQERFYQAGTNSAVVLDDAERIFPEKVAYLKRFDAVTAKLLAAGESVNSDLHAAGNTKAKKKFESRIRKAHGALVKEWTRVDQDEKMTGAEQTSRKAKIDAVKTKLKDYADEIGMAL